MDHITGVYEQVSVCNCLTLKGKMMTDSDDGLEKMHETIIKEIIALERSYFFEKKNVRTERQRKLREVIERHTKVGGAENDS